MTLAREVWFDDNMMRVRVIDGREVAVPSRMVPSTE